MSQCLTKYHTMKTYPVLDQELCHEDIQGTEGIAPHILNLSTGCPSHITPGKDHPVPTREEAGWFPEPVQTW